MDYFPRKFLLGLVALLISQIGMHAEDDDSDHTGSTASDSIVLHSVTIEDMRKAIDEDMFFEKFMGGEKLQQDPQSHDYYFVCKKQRVNILTSQSKKDGPITVLQLEAYYPGIKLTPEQINHFNGRFKFCTLTYDEKGVLLHTTLDVEGGVTPKALYLFFGKIIIPIWNFPPK